MEVLFALSNNNRKQDNSVSDKHAVRKNQTKAFDHEFANEPLTAAEKLNNKKTKKRQ